MVWLDHQWIAAGLGLFSGTNIMIDQKNTRKGRDGHPVHYLAIDGKKVAESLENDRLEKVSRHLGDDECVGRLDARRRRLRLDRRGKNGDLGQSQHGGCDEENGLESRHQICSIGLPNHDTQLDHSQDFRCLNSADQLLSRRHPLHLALPTLVHRTART